MEIATFMKISTTHKEFSDRLNDQTALEYPEHFLGPNWKDVLNFWIYLDTLSVEDFRLIINRFWDVCADARVSARDKAFKAAEATIGNDYTNMALSAAAAADGPAGSSYATLDLIGSHKLESLKFLPLFLTK
jgi:hypothetical protein